MPRATSIRSPSSSSPRGTISSRDNRWLKAFRRALRSGLPAESGGLGTAKARENAEADYVAIEGARLVGDALRSGLEVTAVLVSSAGEHYLRALTPLLGPSVRLLYTSDRLFTGVSDTQSPQGIAALVRPRAARFEDLLHGLPLVMVLVGVQDPGNVGTILRSAEAFGATGAIVCRGTCSPFSAKALRASAGATLRLPVLPGASPAVLIAQLRVNGLRVFAASSGEGADPAEADLRSPLALFIGNEGAGLPPEVTRSADILLRIPIAPALDSLNAGVAASLLLYEAARQRRTTAEP